MIWPMKFHQTNVPAGVSFAPAAARGKERIGQFNSQLTLFKEKNVVNHDDNCRLFTESTRILSSN